MRLDCFMMNPYDYAYGKFYVKYFTQRIYSLCLSFHSVSLCAMVYFCRLAKTLRTTASTDSAVMDDCEDFGVAGAWVAALLQLQWQPLPPVRFAQISAGCLPGSPISFRSS